MTGRIRLARALAALIVGATGGTLMSTVAAYAAACPAGTGVTVVVGSSVGCDSNGGGYASSNFRDAGHSLTYVNNSSFVCRVDGAPSSADCAHIPPSDAYWGLFWSNGTSGSWTYSSQGVSSLQVPTGGWVAFVFQNSTSKTYPGVKPLTAKPPAQPQPKPSASSQPKKSSGSAGSTNGATPSATPTAKGKASTTSPTDPASSSAAAPTDGVTTQPGDDVRNTSAESGGSSSLGWVAGVLAIALLAGMAAVLWRRRVAGGRPT